jgi:hypothetical protein
VYPKKKLRASKGDIPMKVMKIVAVIAVVALLGSAPLWAHHAFAAEFDVRLPVKFSGKLVKWEAVNPHSWFHIDRKEADGKTTLWMVEGGSPSTLARMGVTKNSIKVGTELTVEGYQAKDKTNKAVGRNFILANGERLFLGGSAPGGDGNDKQ